jgi:hypothetical protein
MRMYFLILALFFDAVVTSHRVCPNRAPKSGKKCNLSEKSTCRYNPFSCPGSTSRTFRTTCKCSKKKFRCSTINVSCGGEAPTTCPMEAMPGEACGRLGLKCRYGPIGCVDGIQFATNCECEDVDGKVKFSCTSARIDCEINDADCPTSTSAALGKENVCDPTKVKTCNYKPFGCPGSTEPGFYIEKCYCDPDAKKFECLSASIVPCK